MWKKQSGFQRSDNVTNYSPSTNSSRLCFAVHSAYLTLAQEWLVDYRGPVTTKREDQDMFSKSPPKVGVFQRTFFFIFSYLYDRFLHVDDISGFFLLSLRSVPKIWLSPPEDDGQSTYLTITQLKQKNPCCGQQIFSNKILSPCNEKIWILKNLM